MAAADYRLMSEATGQRIAAALEALSGFGAYLTTADVVDNLTSTATDKPGSANMLRVLEEHIIAHFGVDATIGTTYNIGNQCTCVCFYGWNGLRAIGRISIGAAVSNGNVVFFPKGDYSIVIRNDMCTAKKTESASLTNISANIDSISYDPRYKQITFNFSTAPFGTNDSIIVVAFDGSIIRNQ
jgi:hypothetical protein